MSVNISLSNKNSCGCKEILEKLKKLNIYARCIKTLSLVNNNFEKGSLLTVGSKYILKNDFSNLWDLEYLEYLEYFEDFEDLEDLYELKREINEIEREISTNKDLSDNGKKQLREIKNSLIQEYILWKN